MKFNMKKNNLIVICIIIILAIILINFFDYYYNQLPNVILKEDLTVNVSSEVTNLSFIEKIEGGTIISKEKKIDTSSTGKKEVIITIKNKYGKERQYKYFINVIDID